MQVRNKIAVIGLGFVGGTIYKVYADYALNDANMEVVGIDPAKGLNTPYEDIADADAVFVCVPSPMNKDGTADTSILEDVIAKLKLVNYAGVIISKVTAPPDAYEKLQQDLPNLVHAPEFLTAARAYDDYIQGQFSIIGGSTRAYINEAERIIKKGQPLLKDILHCSIKEASLAKYTINSFLAAKVIFMNELENLAQSSGCNWSTIQQLITLDSRIGRSHMQVPGPDGQYGFGGHCFPKDTSALLAYAKNIGVELDVLDSAVKKNMIIRLTEPK